MNKDTKHIELSVSENEELKAQVIILNELKNEAARAQYVAVVMNEKVNATIKEFAKKHGLEGKDFVYKDGKIEVAKGTIDQVAEAVAEQAEGEDK